MDLQLAGHRAVVTGFSGGIGEAIARKLAAEGAAVVVHGRRADAVQAVTEKITADGGDARGLAAALADPAQCVGFIADALAGGGADILINNASPNRGWDEASPQAVNTVSPGIVVTPGVEAFYRAEAARCGFGQRWAAIEGRVLAEVLDNPTGRLGRPEEVADQVAFVASPLAGYVNGANLRIDDGVTAVI